MPRYPDPDKLPKHEFPQQLLRQIEENSGGFGSFALFTRDGDGDFLIVPHFKNEPDKWAFYSFMLSYCQTMLENQSAALDQNLTEEMFGEDDD